MKTLLTFALCLLAVVAQAANPSTKSFRATGGLVVTSNDVTGVITYDGSGITASATNFPGPSTTPFRAMTNVLWSTVLSVDSTNGTNATAIRGDISKPWRDVITAMAASQSGDTIWVRSGVHNVGSNTLIVLPGRKLIGQGFGSIIRGLGSLEYDGPIVVPGSTSEVAHLTIEHGNLNDYKGATFGFQWVATNGPTHGPTNAVIHDVWMIGDTDCIYLRGTNHWDITGYNVFSKAKFDSFVQFPECSNGVSRWFSSSFESDMKGSLNSYTLASSNATAVKASGGVVEFMGCVAIGTNGSGTTRGLAVSTGATVRWNGGLIKAAGTNNVFPAELVFGGTLIYSGNQLGMPDISGGAGVIWGSQQSFQTNIAYPDGVGVVFTDASGFEVPVFITPSGGLNIGALTNVPAGRLQVSSLPGSGDFVAADVNGLLFSTNAPAGGGSVVTNANQFGASPTLTLKSGVALTNPIINGLLQYGDYAGTVAGWSNVSAGQLSLYLTDISDNDWAVANRFTVGSLPGSGSYVAHVAGLLMATNAPAGSGTPGGGAYSLQGTTNGTTFNGDSQALLSPYNLAAETGPFIMLNDGSGQTNFMSPQGFGTSTADDVAFFANNTARWYLTSDGHWNPSASNLFDFGSFLFTPRTNYAQQFVAKVGMTVGTGNGFLGWGTNFAMVGAVSSNAYYEITPTNALAGVVVALPVVAGVTNQRATVAGTAGQVLSWHNGIPLYTNASGGITTNYNALFASGVIVSNTLTASNITATAPGSSIFGITNGGDASAGVIGEYIQAAFTSRNCGTTDQYFDATNIVLTAGDWDITALIRFNRNSSTNVGHNYGVGASTTSGNSSTGLTVGDNFLSHISSHTNSFDSVPISVPNWRYNTATNVTIYMKTIASYGAGAPNMSGKILARRMR